MVIDIWSDVICPFCYIGKRHLEAALADYAEPVTLRWHSFELDPNSPHDHQDMFQVLMAKYGKSHEEVVQMLDRVQIMGQAAGLSLNLAQSKRINTFDLHRLLHWAAEQGRQSELLERLFSAYFTDGMHLGDHQTVLAVLSELGFQVEQVQDVLQSKRYAELVREDESAARSLGASGVPFFVFNEQYAISGAQPVTVFKQVLAQAAGSN